MPLPKHCGCLAAAALCWYSLLAFGSGLPGREGVLVTPDYEGLAGEADAASQGTVEADQLTSRPLPRPAEVLEVIPGVVVTQHSGSGKANQYFLRGFNLDHGTDFAVHVDGMPANLPSHGHGQGYADLNFLIPELIEHIHYRKGPYYAEEGDFSAAGAAHIHLRRSLEPRVAEMTTGSFGYQRALFAGSRGMAAGTLLGAFEIVRDNGPWVNPDNLRKMNALLRLADGTEENGYAITAMAYVNRWSATDQIPQRAVASGELSRFAAVDASDGGTASRHSVSAQWSRTADTEATRASAYIISSRLRLFSNFTYFLNDAVNGDQFEQTDRRVTAGADASHTWRSNFEGREIEHTAGARLRRDHIGQVGLFRTVARNRIAAVRSDSVLESGASAYYSIALRWSPWLKTLAGARADAYRFNVASDNALNSGRGQASLLSPKLGLVLGPWREIEYFANAGYGFHSNDVRGATIAVDPTSGAPTQRVLPLVRARGGELGLRAAPFNGVQTSMALWRLDIGSELIFVGDAGTTQAGRPSRRQGLEWAIYSKLRRNLTLDFDMTLSRARFKDSSPAGNHIPGAVDRTLSGGLTYAGGPWSVGLRVRHLGARALVADDSQRSGSSTLLNAKLGYTPRIGVKVGVEALNIANRKVDDITYFYASRLPGEPAAGVQDKHFHPAEPRSLRLSLRLDL